MVLLIVLGLLISLLGLAGCILPVIPGPPLSFIALLILHLAKDGGVFSTSFIILMAALTVAVTLLDYIVPAAGAKKYGASRTGVWGSVLGMVIGILFFPPWGVFFGALFGAVLGELITGKETATALRAGWGVFVGNLFGVGLKLAASAVMLFFYIKEMF